MKSAPIPPAPLTENLLSTKEAAARLCISTRKLWTLTNAREIAHVRIGGKVLYKPSSLQAYIDARIVTARG